MLTGVTVIVTIAPVILTGVNVAYHQVFSVVVVQLLCYLFCDLFFCKAAINDGEKRGSLTWPAKCQNHLHRLHWVVA